MQTIKTIFQFIEGVVATFWGLTIIDYFAVPKPINYNLQDIISSGVQSLYIVVGLVYFILNGIFLVTSATFNLNLTFGFAR
jgi:hypothetical protein